MITLISGVPGAGKTLFAVTRLIRELEKNPERDVFSDVKGLKIEGVKPPPDDWRDTPEGSLIIYDECQYRDIFKRERGRSRYQCILDLTTHRHTGRDIWLITQSPIFLHTDVLAVVGEHFHLNRPYGAKLAVIYKWRVAETKPQSVNVQRRAENKAYFKYNKDVFNFYDSVDVSDDLANHKGFSIPFLHYLPILFGVLVLVWAVNSFFSSDNKLNVDKKVVDKQDVEEKRHEVLKLVNASAPAPAVASVPVASVVASVPAVVSSPVVVASVPAVVSSSVVASVPVPVQVQKVVDSRPANVVVFNGKCSAYTVNGDKLFLSNDDCLKYSSNQKPIDIKETIPDSSFVLGDRLVKDDVVEPVDSVHVVDKPLQINKLSDEQEKELDEQLLALDKPLHIVQLDNEQNLALSMEIEAQLLLNDDVEVYDDISVVGVGDFSSVGVGEL